MDQRAFAGFDAIIPERWQLEITTTVFMSVNYESDIETGKRCDKMTSIWNKFLASRSGTPVTEIPVDLDDFYLTGYFV